MDTSPPIRISETDIFSEPNQLPVQNGNGDSVNDGYFIRVDALFTVAHFLTTMSQRKPPCGPPQTVRALFR